MWGHPWNRLDPKTRAIGCRRLSGIQRLTALRQAVASGLLEVSAAAKRDAERLLSGEGGDTAAPQSGTTSERTWWSHPLLYGSFAAGLFCGFLVALLLRPAGFVTPISEVAEVAEVDPRAFDPADESVQPQTANPAPSSRAVSPQTEPPPAPAASEPRPAPVTSPEPRPEPTARGGAGSDELVLRLTTRDDCWLSKTVDGADPVERLLPAGRTVSLEVQQEAVLKIGNAAAVSILINGQPARPLGAEGQVVTLRITPSNYNTFLG